MPQLFYQARLFRLFCIVITAMVLQLGLMQNASSEDFATDTTLSNFHFYDTLVEGNITYALVGSQTATQVFSDPDNSKFPVREIWLLRIDNNTRKITWASKIGDYAAAHGVLSVVGDSIRAAFNYKVQSGTYSMNFKQLSWNKVTLTSTGERLIFSGANCGWYPRFVDASTVVEHFCYSGYYRYRDISLIAQVSPAVMSQEYNDILKAHSYGIVPKTTDAEVVQAILKSFPSLSTVSSSTSTTVVPSNMVAVNSAVITAPLASGNAPVAQMKEGGSSNPICNSMNWNDNNPPEIEEIPCIMRQKLGWNIASTLMEHWFSEDDYYSYVNSEGKTVITRKNYILDDHGVSLEKLGTMSTKVADAIKELSSPDIFKKPEVQENLIKELLKSGLLSNDGDFDYIKAETSIGDGWHDFDWEKLNLHWIRGVEIKEDISKVDEFLGAFGASSVRAVAKGKVTLDKGTVTVIVDGVGIYFRDSYDFRDDSNWRLRDPRTWISQPLGCWSKQGEYVGASLCYNKIFVDSYKLNSLTTVAIATSPEGKLANSTAYVSNNSFTLKHDDSAKRDFRIFTDPNKMVILYKNPPKFDFPLYKNPPKALKNIELLCPKVLNAGVMSSEACKLEAIYDIYDYENGITNVRKDISSTWQSLLVSWKFRDGFGRDTNLLTIDNKGYLIADSVLQQDTEVAVTASYEEAGVKKDVTVMVQVNKKPIVTTTPVVPKTPVVSPTVIKNDPTLLTPLANAQGLSVSNVDFTWNINGNSLNTITDVVFTLAETNGNSDTVTSYVGTCQKTSVLNKGINGTSTNYSSKDCGTLKPNQWYKWFVELHFTDGSIRGLGNHFMTAPVTTTPAPPVVNTVDTIKPIGKITSTILAGYTQGDKIAMGWTATDNKQLAKVTLNVATSSGVLVSSVSNSWVVSGTSASNSYNIDTGLLPAGVYYYALWVKDASGNELSAATGSFTIKEIPDTTKPTGRITSTIGGSYLKGDKIAMGWTATDNKQLAKVTLNVTTSSGVLVSSVSNSWVVSGTSASNSYNIDTGLLPAGVYYYALWVKDASGNELSAATGSFTIKEIPDTTKPTGKITSTISTSYVKGKQIPVSWTASDNKQLAKISFNVTTSSGVLVSSVSNSWAVSGTTASNSYSINTGSLSVGTYYYALWVKDAAGNEIAYNGSFNITLK